MKTMHRIDRGTIWGGYKNADLSAQTGALTASLFSSAANGGKGGDMYYLSVCNGDLLSRIVIGDVVGHGEQVSTVSSWLYESLFERLNICGEHSVVDDMNEVAMERGLSALTTMASLSYNLKDRQLSFSYAGHPPAFINKHNNSEWQPLTITSDKPISNIPLGITYDAYYDQLQIPMESGDRIFIYTDGVVEAQNEEGNLFGEQSLLSLLQEIGPADTDTLKSSVLDSLIDYTGSPDLTHDDVTLIVASIN